MLNNSSQNMNLYKSNISVLKSFSMSKHYTCTSDGTTKKLSKTTMLGGGVCVCVCVHSQLRSHTVYDTLHSRCTGHRCKETHIATIYANIQKKRQRRYHCQIWQASTGKTNVSCSSSENGKVGCVWGGGGHDDRQVKIISESEKIGGGKSDKGKCT